MQILLYVTKEAFHQIWDRQQTRQQTLDIYNLLISETIKYYRGLDIALVQWIRLIVAVFSLTLLLGEDLSIRIGFQNEFNPLSALDAFYKYNIQIYKRHGF